MSAVLSEFIQILIGGITDIAQGIGSGVNQYVSDLFLVTGTDGAVTGLSTFGGVIAIFGK